MSESPSDPLVVAVQQIPHADSTPADQITAQLNVGQLRALDALMAGISIKEAAHVADVGRATIYRWLSTDPYFKAAYNAWKQEARESAKGLISNMVLDAVANVAKALSTGDPKLSYQLLKDLGFLAAQKDAPTDPALVRQQIAADLHGQNPLTDAAALQQLLTQAGLSKAQQRRLFVQALRPAELKAI